MIIATQTELALWLSGDKIDVFIEDDAEPTDSVDLLELVHQEIMSHVLPASANTLDDVESMSIDGQEQLEKLNEFLAEAMSMVSNVLAKTR